MLMCSRPRAQEYPLELYCPSLRVRPQLSQSPVLINSPGWVWTPLAGASSGKDKPNAPWTAEQTVDYMFEKVFDNGDFYVICPDNEVTSVSTPLYRQSQTGLLVMSLRTDLPFLDGTLPVSSRKVVRDIF
jgi:hypothetical protein